MPLTPTIDCGRKGLPIARTFLFALPLLLIAAFVFGPDLPWFRRLPDDVGVALDRADTYELFSIDPVRPDQLPPDDYHGYRVLGRTTVVDPGVRMRINDALRVGARNKRGNRAMCFDPRHGIRVTRKGVTTDLLICFECEWAKYTCSDGAVGIWMTAPSPQPTLDAILRDAGIPLAPTDEQIARGVRIESGSPATQPSATR